MTILFLFSYFSEKKKKKKTLQDVAIRPKVHTQGRRRRRSSARAVIHRCPPLRHSTQLFPAACQCT